MYDVIIVGAGIIGSSIAREFSKYKLNVLVLEKEIDVCEGTTGANSAIIHSGYDPKPGTLKARFNKLGNYLYPKLCKELDVPFIKNGSLTLAFNEEEVEILKKLELRARKNHVSYRMFNAEEINLLEPNVSLDAMLGLYAFDAGIVNPFEMNVALMENAIDNGVILHLNEEVKEIEMYDDYNYEVITNKDKYRTKYLVNAAGVYAEKVNRMIGLYNYTIKPRKGEYFLLDHIDKPFVRCTLFSVPTSKGKGVIVAPTTGGNYIVGPSSEFVEKLDDVAIDLETLATVKKEAAKIVPEIDYSKQIREFAGLRAVSDSGDFIVEESPKAPGFINAAGIQSPGLTAAPAIALYVVDMVKDKEPNENFNPNRRKVIRMNKLTIEERNEIIKNNPLYGKIICRCEKISEGEIVDAIHRSCGATTIKGIKKRVRAGFGKCQGGFCENHVLNILARELGKDPTKILYAKKGSNVLVQPLGGKNDKL